MLDRLLHRSVVFAIFGDSDLSAAIKHGRAHSDRKKTGTGLTNEILANLADRLWGLALIANTLGQASPKASGEVSEVTGAAAKPRLCAQWMARVLGISRS